MKSEFKTSLQFASLVWISLKNEKLNENFRIQKYLQTFLVNLKENNNRIQGYFSFKEADKYPKSFLVNEHLTTYYDKKKLNKESELPIHLIFNRASNRQGHSVLHNKK